MLGQVYQIPAPQPESTDGIANSLVLVLAAIAVLAWVLA
jgi:hypothetical protein